MALNKIFNLVLGRSHLSKIAMFRLVYAMRSTGCAPSQATIMMSFDEKLHVCVQKVGLRSNFSHTEG